MAIQTQTQYNIVFSVWGCTERKIKRERVQVFMCCETDETSKPVCGRQKNEGSVREASFHRNTSPVAFGGRRGVDTVTKRCGLKGRAVYGIKCSYSMSQRRRQPWKKKRGHKVD